jgi:hypothetical protein
MFGSGSLYISFELKADAYTAYGRVYRNGVAVGTEQSTTSGTYVVKGETISGWANGDKIQLYIHHLNGDNTAFAENFRIYGSNFVVNTD